MRAATLCSIVFILVNMPTDVFPCCDRSSLQFNERSKIHQCCLGESLLAHCS